MLSNPLAYSDPSGLTAAAEYGANSGRSGSTGAGYAATGQRISCVFTALAGAFELLAQDDITSVDVFMVGTETAMACGARGKKRKSGNKDNPGKTCGGTRCFAAGTLVHTEDGLKPIENIVPGDLVKSMDTVTGEIAYKPVTEIHTNQFDPVGQVTLLDETDGSETVLSVTASHPFYSQDREWVHASKLQVDEKLIEDSGGTLTVTSVEFNPNAKTALTYNLTVGEYQTYFVGEDGVLVHNGRWRRGVIIFLLSPRLIAGDIDLPNSDGSNGRMPPRPATPQTCPVPVDPRRWRKVFAFGKSWKIND